MGWHRLTETDGTSQKGKRNVFCVSLTTIILNCFLCVLDKRSREQIKTWAGLHVHVWMFFWTVVARVCMGGSSYTGARSLLCWKVVFMFLYLPPGPGGTAMSEGRICPDRNWPLSNWCPIIAVNNLLKLIQDYYRVHRIYRVSHQSKRATARLRM